MARRALGLPCGTARVLSSFDRNGKRRDAPRRDEPPHSQDDEGLPRRAQSSYRRGGIGLLSRAAGGSHKRKKSACENAAGRFGVTEDGESFNKIIDIQLK